MRDISHMPLTLILLHITEVAARTTHKDNEQQKEGEPAPLQRSTLQPSHCRPWAPSWLAPLADAPRARLQHVLQELK